MRTLGENASSIAVESIQQIGSAVEEKEMNRRGRVVECQDGEDDTDIADHIGGVKDY